MKPSTNPITGDNLVSKSSNQDKSKLYSNILTNVQIETILLNYRKTDFFGLCRVLEEAILDKLREQTPACYMLEEINAWDCRSKLFRSFEPKPENIDNAHWEVTPLFKLPRKEYYE